MRELLHNEATSGYSFVITVIGFKKIICQFRLMFPPVMTSVISKSVTSQIKQHLF